MKSKAPSCIDNLPIQLRELKELKLGGLETLRQYNKKLYTELQDVQRKFNNVSLPIVIIKKDSSEDIKYDIFSRINSGAIKLNHQELLNAMYRGKLLCALNEASTTCQVDKLFGYRPVLKKRFGYHEILLRAKVMESFIDKETWKIKAVKIKNKENFNAEKEFRTYNGRLNSAVLEYLKEYRDDENEGYELKKFINDSLEKVDIVFGEKCFKRINAGKATSINKTIAELQIVVLSKFDLEFIKKNKVQILNSFNNFLESNSSDVFTRGTNNTTNINKRYEWGAKVFNIFKGNY